MSTLGRAEADYVSEKHKASLSLTPCDFKCVCNTERHTEKEPKVTDREERKNGAVHQEQRKEEKESYALVMILCSY